MGDSSRMRKMRGSAWVIAISLTCLFALDDVGQFNEITRIPKSESSEDKHVDVFGSNDVDDTMPSPVKPATLAASDKLVSVLFDKNCRRRVRIPHRHLSRRRSAVALRHLSHMLGHVTIHHHFHHESILPKPKLSERTTKESTLKTQEKLRREKAKCERKTKQLANEKRHKTSRELGRKVHRRKRREQDGKRQKQHAEQRRKAKEVKEKSKGKVMEAKVEKAKAKCKEVATKNRAAKIK